MSAHLPAPELGPMWNRSAHLLRQVAAEVSPAAWQEVRDDLARIAQLNLDCGLAVGRRHARKVRAELGLTTVRRERVELTIDTSGFAAAMEKATRAATRFRRAFLRPTFDQVGRPLEETPIHDALVAERSTP